MREFSLREGEASLEGLPQHCTISMTLDRRQDLRSSPVPSCFSTMTRLPLCTPARTMATVPAVREASFFASKMSPSFLDFSAFTLAKYLSLMFSGTETLEMSSFVEVATKYL